MNLDNLFEALKQLWNMKNGEVRENWNRSLPFSDYIVDRWDRARALGFGEGSSIYDSVLVLGDVTVGEKTWIGPFCILDGSGGLQIGNYCSVSAGVQIYSHDTVKWATSGGRQDAEKSPTRIGDRCYIGPNTIVSKGVSIGDGCIIGANSLVLKDLPAGAKAFGSPCRIKDGSGQSGYDNCG